MTPDLRAPRLAQEVLPQTKETALGPVEFVDVGNGPAVVCLHGAMGGYDQSLILAQTIGAEGYRYLCLSRPGYLGTPMRSRGTPEQQADLIAALLDTLGVAKAGVFAVSGGGPAAILFALRHPGRCQGLVLVSTCADKVETKIPLSFKITQLLARSTWFVDKIRRKAEKNLADVAKRSIRDPQILQRTLNDQEAWPLFSALIMSTFDRMGHRLAGTQNDILVSRTTSYPLENLSTPALIVHGTHDQLVPFEAHAKVFERRLPNAELLAVSGGEHVSIFTHREEVRSKVSEFSRRYFR